MAPTSCRQAPVSNEVQTRHETLVLARTTLSTRLALSQADSGFKLQMNEQGMNRMLAPTTPLDLFATALYMPMQLVPLSSYPEQLSPEAWLVMQGVFRASRFLLNLATSDKDLIRRTKNLTKRSVKLAILTIATDLVGALDFSANLVVGTIVALQDLGLKHIARLVWNWVRRRPSSINSSSAQSTSPTTACSHRFVWLSRHFHMLQVGWSRVWEDHDPGIDAQLYAVHCGTCSPMSRTNSRYQLRLCLSSEKQIGCSWCCRSNDACNLKVVRATGLPSTPPVMRVTRSRSKAQP
ncbi:hypothetical protein EXIGLDRAFT_71282 [Exidia glandulosa HHB12029]|uniref:Uncharacterized protein n=1 Tax=Exidia glandulosa HHB12029 TaxID=1314781 RepID=A0A166MJP9_EXIGL|nr:hypothetical protein EXIGLDRAFT_71282 [Exidia glandulosa HHB12029]